MIIFIAHCIIYFIKLLFTRNLYRTNTTTMETMRDETPADPPAQYKYVFTHRSPNSSLIVIQDHHEDTHGPVEDLKHFYLMFESESLPSHFVYRNS